MMGRLRRFHPFLFVIIPVLNVMARNPGGATLRDVFALSLAMMVACGTVYAVAALALRRRGEKEAVPLLVLLLVILFYAYPAFRAAYNQSRGDLGRLSMTGALVLGVMGAAVAGIWWLARRPALLTRANTFLGVMGLLVVGSLGARVLTDQVRARSQLRSSLLAKKLAQPISARSNPGSDTKPLPDIYILILDEYANSGVLRERFGFENGAFEDSLRHLGFTIPTLVRSNYAHTLLSLPSLLNFAYLTDLGKELGPSQTDPTIPNHLVENNRTVFFLRDWGYRFVFFPSQWWISTERNRHADSEFRVWEGFHLGRAATRSDLRRAFVSRTPLALLQRGDRHDADHVKRTLTGLAELTSDRAPTFALAHFLNPHYPYVFDAECRLHSKRPARKWGQGREQDYLEQLQCLNHLLLGTVTKLVQDRASDPIILLVGDHGTNALGYNLAPRAEDVSPDQARERLGAFAAFRLPRGVKVSVPDSVTLVNLVPRLLNTYFDTHLPVLPDSLYMSLERTPYLFAPVDPVALTPRCRNGGCSQ